MVGNSAFTWAYIQVTTYQLNDLETLLTLPDPPSYYFYNGYKKTTSVTVLLGGLDEIMLVIPLGCCLTHNST